MKKLFLFKSNDLYFENYEIDEGGLEEANIVTRGNEMDDTTVAGEGMEAELEAIAEYKNLR